MVLRKQVISGYGVLSLVKVAIQNGRAKHIQLFSKNEVDKCPCIDLDQKHNSHITLRSPPKLYISLGMNMAYTGKSTQYFRLLGHFFYYLSALKARGFIVLENNTMEEFFESFLTYVKENCANSVTYDELSVEIGSVREDIKYGMFDHLKPRLNTEHG